MFVFEYFVSSDCPMILCYYFMTLEKAFSHMCIMCESLWKFFVGSVGLEPVESFPMM